MMNTISKARKEVPKAATSYLTFALGDEQYGIEILKVQEIIGLLPITRVPNARPEIKGLVNLRGKILPVIDLRLRFRMERQEAAADSCIVFVRVNGAEAGLLVDRVSEVLEIPEEAVEKDQTFSIDCLLGIGKVGGRAKLLLDLEKVFHV